MTRLFGSLLNYCALSALLAAPPQLLAQPVPEYDLKAAFVYNFALFTEWPAEAAVDGNFTVCVHPRNPLKPSLSGLAGKTIKGRKLVLREVSASEGLRNCQLLVVDALDRERWPQMRKALASSSVLVVADDEEMRNEGPAISLAMEGQRVVFDIDLKAAQQARLVLSSKLLRLARRVN